MAVDVNCLYPRSGDTPLIAAAKNDDTAMCEMLVEANADPNFQNNRGNSVLHIAHSRENTDLVEYLENLDIMKCSLRNDNGYTAQKISQRLQRARKTKEVRFFLACMRSFVRSFVRLFVCSFVRACTHLAICLALCLAVTRGC